MKTHIIDIEPTKSSVNCEENRKVLSVLRDSKIPIKSSCNGKGTCGDCKIKIIKGYEHVSEPTFSEKKLLGNVFHIVKERLSCQISIKGPITIDINEHVNPPKKAPKVQIKKRKDMPEKSADQKNDQQNNQEERPVKQGGYRRPKRK